VIVIISEIIIVSLAPIDNPNLNLTEEEIMSMKKQIKRLVVLLSVILILLMLWGKGIRFISPIVVGIVLDAMFIVVAKIHKKRGERSAEGKRKRLGIN
ncbi:MAG: accessory gene regulator B family protein, partial [Lachnospiraceae bacterium]|nr:accessory gene regulator B family protein [Lachnospiraceae bacterium]